MPFTLRIDFQGMIGVVPINGGDSLQMLFVDGRKGCQVSDGDHIPPHFPVIRFERPNVADPKMLADHEEGLQKIMYTGEQELSSADDLVGYWFLDSQELELHYEGEPADNQKKLLIWDEDTAHQANGNVNGRGPNQYFSRIPHLDLVQSPASRIDPDCLLPQPREGLIAARFKIRDGIVQSLDVFRDQLDQLVPITFRPLGSSLPDAVLTQPAISTGLQLEVQVPGESAILVSTAFGETVAKPVLKLAPVKGENVVNVKIWNLPLTEIFGLPELDHQMGAEDKHFELFYELSLRRPPLHNRPVPHLTTSGNSMSMPGMGGPPIHLQTPFCPPVVFQG